MLPSVVILRTLVPVVVVIGAFLASTAHASASNPTQSFPTKVPLEVLALIGDHIATTRSPTDILNFAMMYKSMYERLEPALAERLRPYPTFIADAESAIKKELNELGSIPSPRFNDHIRDKTAPGIRKALESLDQFIGHTRTKVQLSLPEGAALSGFQYLVMSMASDYYGRKNSDDVDLLGRFGFDATDLFKVVCHFMKIMAYAGSHVPNSASSAKETLLFLKPTWERIFGQPPENQSQFLCRPYSHQDPDKLAAAVKENVSYLEKYVGAKWG